MITTATSRIGASIMRTIARPVSIESVMKIPPKSRNGARIAIVCVICMNDCTLYESLVILEISDGSPTSSIWSPERFMDLVKRSCLIL